MNAPVELKLPPHSTESEQSLIGGLLLDNSAYDRIVGMVTDADFYRDDHRRIFCHIRKLLEAHQPADVVTVYASIEKSNEVEQTGGQGYLGDIANATPSAAAIKRYARIVSERAKLRRLIQAADQIGHAAYYSADPVEKQIDDAEAALFALSGTMVAESEPMSITQVMGPVIDRIQERYDSDGTLSGLPTGFADVDAMTDGLQRGDLIILAGRPSMGKALSVDSQVLSPTGWLRMGDIKVGDLVIGGNGNSYPVLGVFPQGALRLYRVTFDDGAEVVCCDDHLWLTSSRADRKAGRTRGRVRKLSEIRETLRVGGRDNRLNHQIPWMKPPCLVCGEPNAHHSLDPYLLGLWLGDGSIDGKNVRFHNPEQDLIDSFARLLPVYDKLSGAGKEWRVVRKKRDNTRSEMSDALGHLGLHGSCAATKFVPPQYLWSSAEDRLALLRGLLDTDGYCYGAGVEYTTSSSDLADAVRFLVRSLGGRVTTVVRTPKFSYLGEKRTGLPSHRMVISFDSDIVPVSSAKHLAVFRGVSRRTGRYIASVEPVGVHEAQCITVGSPDGLFVTDDFVVTHNTAFALNVAENVALQDELVLVFSLEMSPDQLGMRTLASVGRINSTAMRSGKLHDDDWDRMTNALGRLHERPLYIDQSTSPTVAQMAGKARRLAKKTGKRLALIVIDYLQLMEAEGQNRNDELSGITRRMKLMAKDLDCPVICLSQLSRKVEERSDKRPILSDLRESGAIEQDADIVAMMYRDDYYRDDSPWAGMAELLIRKQRNGPTGDVKLVFQKEYSRFSDASPQAIAQAAEQARERKPKRGGFKD